MAQNFDHIHLPPDISSIVKGAPEDGVDAFGSSLKGDAVIWPDSHRNPAKKVRTR